MFYGHGVFVLRQHVDVPMCTLEKTLADAFRNPKLVERSVAIKALKATLSRKKSTPAKIAEAAKSYAAPQIGRAPRPH